MARSRKKALSQQVVGVATTGMPAPIRKFLGARITALLIVLITPVLFATGVVSLEWQNGRPKFAFNKQRAEEVKEETAHKIKDLRDESGHDRSGLQKVFAGNGHDKPSKFMAGLKPKETIGEQLSNGVEEVRESLGGEAKKGFSLIPNFEAKPAQGEQASRVKDLFDKRR